MEVQYFVKKQELFYSLTLNVPSYGILVMVRCSLENFHLMAVMDYLNTRSHYHISYMKSILKKPLYKLITYETQLSIC